MKMLNAYSMPLDLKIAQDRLQLVQPTPSVIFNRLCGFCLCIFSIQFLLSYSLLGGSHMGFFIGFKITPHRTSQSKDARCVCYPSKAFRISYSIYIPAEL